MWGLLLGWSLDLTTVDPKDGKPWDFSIQSKRDRVEQMIRDKQALLLIGSPMCSAFSQLQLLNRHKMGEEEYNNKAREATEHLRFCTKLHEMQLDNGMYFLHEHPSYAKSWKEDTIGRLLKGQRVFAVEGDMCMFGMQ